MHLDIVSACNVLRDSNAVTLSLARDRKHQPVIRGYDSNHVQAVGEAYQEVFQAREVKTSVEVTVVPDTESTEVCLFKTMRFYTYYAETHSFCGIQHHHR